MLDQHKLQPAARSLIDGRTMGVGGCIDLDTCTPRVQRGPAGHAVTWTERAKN